MAGWYYNGQEAQKLHTTLEEMGVTTSKAKMAGWSYNGQDAQMLHTTLKDMVVTTSNSNHH
jgi:hypothetical protein